MFPARGKLFHFATLPDSTVVYGLSDISRVIVTDTFSVAAGDSISYFDAATTPYNDSSQTSDTLKCGDICAIVIEIDACTGLPIDTIAEPFSACKIIQNPACFGLHIVPAAPDGNGCPTYLQVYVYLCDTAGHQYWPVKPDAYAVNLSLPLSGSLQKKVSDNFHVQSPFLSVLSNYPNPANPFTTIAYTVGETGDVRIRLYDVYGRHLRDVFEGTQTAGVRQVNVDLSDLPAGTYVYSIQNEENVATGHFVVVK